MLTTLVGVLRALKATAEPWTGCRTPAYDSHPYVRHIHARNRGPSYLADLRNCGNLTRGLQFLGIIRPNLSSRFWD